MSLLGGLDNALGSLGFGQGPPRIPYVPPDLTMGAALDQLQAQRRHAFLGEAWGRAQDEHAFRAALTLREPRAEDADLQRVWPAVRERRPPGDWLTVSPGNLRRLLVEALLRETELLLQQPPVHSRLAPKPYLRMARAELDALCPEAPVDWDPLDWNPVTPPAPRRLWPRLDFRIITVLYVTAFILFTLFLAE